MTGPVQTLKPLHQMTNDELVSSRDFALFEAARWDYCRERGLLQYLLANQFDAELMRRERAMLSARE
jgi:hypothetical protein